MTTSYNQIAGRNLHRVEALSDGVFAVAMTLLVLDLVPHPAELYRSDAPLTVLKHVAPRLLTYLMSFLTLGIFWIGQQTQHDFLRRSERGYAWFNILFLMAVCLVPFSTAFLAEYITFKVAVLVYWVNIFSIGIAIAARWLRARAMRLIKADAPADIVRAILRRLVVAQLLYAFGAALCVFNTYWSIGFIVAVQLQYAIAPRFRPFVWL